jgi:hypothetical protein
MGVAGACVMRVRTPQNRRIEHFGQYEVMWIDG